MKKVLVYICVVALFAACSDENIIKLEVNDAEKGWYHILWTSDTLKCNTEIDKKLKFDKNNVVYIHQKFLKEHALQVVDKSGKDISNRMKKFLGNEYYMSFYYPTKDDEIEASKTDNYYQRLSSYWTKEKLKELGYILNDKNIIPLHKEE